MIGEERKAIAATEIVTHPPTPIRRATVRITELVPSGWRVEWTSDSFAALLCDDEQDTAFGAQKLVADVDAAFANGSNVSSVTTIEWMTTTRAGAAVVRALTSASRKGGKR